MWNWFNCFISGRHEFGVWCEPGAIFLRCVHCGRRSSGWAIAGTKSTSPAPLKPRKVASNGSPKASRVVKFQRSAAR
jgi:hypothetical protein